MRIVSEMAMIIVGIEPIVGIKTAMRVPAATHHKHPVKVTAETLTGTCHPVKVNIRSIPDLGLQGCNDTFEIFSEGFLLILRKAIENIAKLLISLFFVSALLGQSYKYDPLVFF